MDELQKVFNYGELQVRTVLKDEDIWFVARDVCDAIEIDLSQTRRLDDDEKGLHSIQTLGGTQKVAVVNEAGLYSLILGSRKHEAKQFKRWITHEVIPSIRKHGTYMTPETIEQVLLNPDTIIKIATQLKEEQSKRAAAEKTIEEQKPKVLFAEAVSASNTSILIGELSKILKQNGVEIGQNRLFQWLRDNGYLGKRGEQRNLPTQKSMEMGLFEIKKSTVNNPDGSIRTTRTSKVTGKGQIYFVNKLLKEA